MKNKIKMLNKIKKNKILIIVLILIAFLIFFLSMKKEGNEKDIPNGDILPSEQDNNWKVYKNETYGFQLEFPATWKVYESYENASPIINIYNPEFNSNPPYDHFSNISNFSIFPKGLPTEGVAVQNIELNQNNLDFDYPIEIARNYIFENGQVWGTYVNPENFNSEWKDWGFIWVKAKIELEKYSCLSGGIKISADQCDVFSGDQLILNGEIDSEIRKKELKILKSFKKIDN